MKLVDMRALGARAVVRVAVRVRARAIEKRRDPHLKGKRRSTILKIYPERSSLVRKSTFLFFTPHMTFNFIKIVFGIAAIGSLPHHLPVQINQIPLPPLAADAGSAP